MYLGFRVDYTLHVLDSMFIVTLCSSSIIIYVLIIIRNTSFDQSLGKVARDAENVSFYDAFSRVQSLDHANPSQQSSGHANVVILPRVQSLDQANPL